MFTAALRATAKTWTKPKCPSTDGWHRKTWYVCTVEYYSAIQKREILPFAPVRMDLEYITLRDGSQAEKHKDMWNLNRTTNECMCQRETDPQT